MNDYKMKILNPDVDVRKFYRGLREAGVDRYTSNMVTAGYLAGRWAQTQKYEFDVPRGSIEWELQ